MQAKLTLIGMYNYLYDEDNDEDILFQNFFVPDDTFNPDLLINNILLRGGPFELMYPDADFMIQMIGAWCAKWQGTMQRWWDAFDQTYSPISNYDRNESWTDTGSGTGSGSSSGTSSNTTSGTTGGTDEGTVSAFNVSTYSPKDKHTTSGTSSDTSSGTNSGQTSSSYSNSLSRTGHIYGNIGVTTNQQMIQAELDLYKQNLYDELADVFIMEFCIPVY